MSLSSSTFLGLEDGQQFQGIMVQRGYEFGLNIHSGDSLKLGADLKKKKNKRKDKKGQGPILY